jgi:ABC-type multidrug transport system ATPase subunit
VTDVIATRGLVKRFGRVTAVSGIDLRIPAGIRFGLLGPNGSGKTTLVRMLLGLVHATAGEVELLGEPMPRGASKVLPRVGALVEGPAAWADLSGRTNLRLIDAAGPGRGQGRRRRVDEALERVGLGGIDRRPVRAYSLGMRQRLGLAAALLRGPELLLLDEPTNGLGPRGIGEIRARGARARRRQRGAAAARRCRRDRAVPPDGALAGLDRPLPRPDPVVRGARGGGRPGRVRAGGVRGGVGELRDEGRHELSGEFPGHVRRLD